MTEEWIVRVEGKEYGPVDADSLREWRREGRLIPTNEVRLSGTEDWISAGELPEVFADAPPPPLPSATAHAFEGAKTWGQLFAETFRIYRRGFVPFMFFGLLVSVPIFIGQWTMPKFELPDLFSVPDPATIPTPPPICLAMFLLVLLVWPISTAGFQIVADRIFRGESSSFADQFSTALRCWGRVAGTAILVYGSYFFWIFVPLTAMLAPLNSGNLLLVMVVILVVGLFMVYMNARLFVNFLFWEQTTVIDLQPPMMAMVESKELARSVPEAPPLDRPLYRGAILASVWLALLLGLTFAVQMTSMMIRMAGTTDVEQAVELAKKAMQTPDALAITTNVVAAVINLLLRPLLAASFVVLFYDAKARSGRSKESSR